MAMRVTGVAGVEALAPANGGTCLACAGGSGRGDGLSGLRGLAAAEPGGESGLGGLATVLALAYYTTGLLYYTSRDRAARSGVHGLRGLRGLSSPTARQALLGAAAGIGGVVGETMTDSVLFGPLLGGLAGAYVVERLGGSAGSAAQLAAIGIGGGYSGTLLASSLASNEDGKLRTGQVVLRAAGGAIAGGAVGGIGGALALDALGMRGGVRGLVRRVRAGGRPPGVPGPRPRPASRARRRVA
jgi:hypothetical protein